MEEAFCVQLGMEAECSMAAACPFQVLKLAWFRLGWLCQSLDLGPGRDAASVRKSVFVTVEHAVYHHTHLLYNRHLDQLLLSAMYGFCKVRCAWAEQHGVSLWQGEVCCGRVANGAACARHGVEC